MWRTCLAWRALEGTLLLTFLCEFKARGIQDGMALTAVRVPRPLKRSPPLPTGGKRHAVLSLQALSVCKGVKSLLYTNLHELTFASLPYPIQNLGARARWRFLVGQVSQSGKA
jgi:hypothetical protein